VKKCQNRLTVKLLQKFGTTLFWNTVYTYKWWTRVFHSHCNQYIYWFRQPVVFYILQYVICLYFPLLTNSSFDKFFLSCLKWSKNQEYRLALLTKNSNDYFMFPLCCDTLVYLRYCFVFGICNVKIKLTNINLYSIWH